MLTAHWWSFSIHGRNIDGRSLLHICVDSGDLETAALLVQKGCELNARDKYGETPLHSAVGKSLCAVSKTPFNTVEITVFFSFLSFFLSQPRETFQQCSFC